MSRTTTDRIWFVAAVSLLACGFLAWWLAPDLAQPIAYDPMLASPIPSPANVAYGSMLAMWLSSGILVVCWWRWSAAVEAAGRWYLAPLALALTAPLSMVPMVDFADDHIALAGLLAAGFAVVPLGWSLAARVVDRTRRRRTLVSVIGLACAGVVGSWLVGHGDIESMTRGLRWLVVAGTTMLPAAAVAYELMRDPRRGPVAAQRRIVDGLIVLAIGLLPAITGLVLTFRMWPVLLVPLLAAAVTALLLTRFALLPLARLASNASVQRDRVVAAAETERIRLASALHDGPLADIALLIQRLDERGDADSAAIARGVADELRAVGSELRLPILDDLGTGPALEWLVGRLVQRSGVPVELRQTTVSRPPAPVELAAYRVAQEALVNALKYGAAPITVSYAATLGSVTLSVDDGGPGIDREAPARAEREGRLGLASMIQRAEAVGAQLVLTGRTGGGTHVGLEWHAAGA